jgi:hypothetical protein
MAYISDHAVLRYLERVKGIDIEAVRIEMMVPGVETAIAFGADTVKLGNGARLKMVGDVVSTVYGKDMVDHHRRQHGRLR